jgi:hypothetical protein
MTAAAHQTTDAMTELIAMTEVAKVLQSLDFESVRRVLQWAADRFGVTGTTSTTRQAPIGEQKESTLNSEPPAQSGTVLHKEIADLYAAAAPKGDAEKALVVAYWVQQIKGNGDFDAATINRELKHLGHGVGNITAALGSLIARKPNLVIQTRKAGSSQQARKRYKLTIAGAKYVDNLIQGEE